jgi:hypothetical protein
MWHEPKLTVKVVYDTMENRVLRAMLVWPNSGEFVGLSNGFGPR